MGENSDLPPGAKICISKNMALIFDDFRSRPCFYFFEFCISYAKHCFHPQEVRMKKLFFSHFPTSTHTQSLWPKLKKRYFAFIFSEKCLINTLENVVHLEIEVVAMNFHLYLTWQMLISYFLCLMNTSKEHDEYDGGEIKRMKSWVTSILKILFFLYIKTAETIFNFF